MSRSQRPPRRRGLPAIELLEEGARLLRRAPGCLLAHFVGSAPCVLYAVFFFTDLSRNAFASERVLGASLGLAALYGWMKCWQAVSVAQLNAELLAREAPRWDAPRLLRLVAAQLFVQPIGLLLRLAAGTLVFPYIWVATFFQNVTVLGDGTLPRLRDVLGRAGREAIRWPVGAGALAGLLSIFGFFVYLNFLALLFAAPFLLKTLFGVETVFSRYLLGLLNPTSLLAVFAVTYLVLDPIRKAAVLLRCFHGRSLHTGEDLAVEMQRVRSLSAARVLAVVLLLFAAPPGSRAAAPAEPAKVEATTLDRSIDEVLGRAEFAWRAPRVKPPDSEMSTFQRWVRDARKWLNRVAYKLGLWIKHWLGALFDRERGDPGDGGGGWMRSARMLFWVTLGVTVVVLALLIFRRWRRPRVQVTTAEAMAAAPDLREENVTADQLPEDRWLQLAAELFQRGEMRLALRAFYLAGLAHLSGRELLQLARHKSNRDYERELRRRARTRVELLAAFERNLLAFERAWYGDHAVSAAAVESVSADFERIRAC